MPVFDNQTPEIPSPFEEFQKGFNSQWGKKSAAVCATSLLLLYRRYYGTLYHLGHRGYYGTLIAPGTQGILWDTVPPDTRTLVSTGFIVPEMIK